MQQCATMVEGVEWKESQKSSLRERAKDSQVAEAAKIDIEILI